MKPILLKPSTKSYVWGGEKLKKEWGKQSPADNIAESWELSCNKEGESIIVGGEYDGLALSEYIDRNPMCLGENCKSLEFFPVLIKLIDAKTNLSIQVHPSDDYALENENQYGKTEMWYIVDCEKGSGVYCGFKKPMPLGVVNMLLEKGEILDSLNFIEVKKGDVIFIPSGTVHAICGGLVICEIQQNSALTYRLFDYNRLDKDGKKRELHIDKALNVIDTSLFSVPNQTVKALDENVKMLVKCKYFTTYEMKIDKSLIELVGDDSFVALTAVEGDGEIVCGGESFKVKKGDTYFLPAGLGSYSLNGKMTIIKTKI